MGIEDKISVFTNIFIDLVIRMIKEVILSGSVVQIIIFTGVLLIYYEFLSRNLIYLISNGWFLGKKKHE